MSVPVGPRELARKAADLRQLLEAERVALSWADYQLDALVQRVAEVEAAALLLAERVPRSIATASAYTSAHRHA